MILTASQIAQFVLGLLIGLTYLFVQYTVYGYEAQHSNGRRFKWSPIFAPVSCLSGPEQVAILRLGMAFLIPLTCMFWSFFTKSYVRRAKAKQQ